MPDCPSIFMLAQLSTNELDPVSAERIQGHLKQCDRCSQQFTQTQTNRGQYESRLPQHTDVLLQALSQEAARPARVVPFRSRPLIAGAILLSAAAAILLGVLFFQQPEDAAIPDITYKGSFALSVVAQRNNHQFTVSSQTTLHANDALRFTVEAAGPGYVYIFTLDAHNLLTGLYPFQGEQGAAAHPISKAGAHTLDGSIVLDNSQGTEHIVALFSKHPFDTSIVTPKVAAALIRDSQKTAKATDQTPSKPLLPTALRGASVQVLTYPKQ